MYRHADEILDGTASIFFAAFLSEITYWYILQRREVKRFVQQQEIERKAEKAIAKE